MVRKPSLFIVMLCMIVGLFVIHPFAWAQTEVVAPGVLALSNAYIRFTLGVSGQIEYEDVTYDVPGRFGVVSITGDPETDADNQMPLLWYSDVPLENHWRLRIGNGTVVVGSSGSWTKTPRVIKPAVGQTKGYIGEYIEGEWTTAAVDGVMDPVVFRIHASLVRDQVRLETTVINAGSNQQTIGVSMFTTPLVADSDLTLAAHGFPFLAGTGLLVSENTNRLFYPTLLRSAAIPSTLDIFDNIESPGMVPRYTLRAQDCTAPEYLAIGDWADLQLSSVWLPADFVPDTSVAIDELALVTQWKSTGLASSASRKIVTYYGLGAASSSWTKRSGSSAVQDRAMLAVQGPRALKYDSTGSGTSDLTPNPFTIKAYVNNMSTEASSYDLKNVTAYLSLPDGLEIVPAAGSKKRDIGTVRMNSESTPVEWTVRATGEYCGELEYTVTVSGTSYTSWQQVVSRKIMVPAVKTSLLRQGYQFISVPFNFNDPTITHSLGYPRAFYTQYWDPTLASGTGAYASLSNLESCKGFWIKDFAITTGQSKSFTLAADAMIVGEESGTQSVAQRVDLKTGLTKPGNVMAPGWNMVGNPFVYPVYLGQLLVQRRGDILPFDKAVKANWINRTFYTYNWKKKNYDCIQSNDSYLLPWKGYWVRTKVPVTLIFQPALFPGTSVTTLPGGF